MNLHDNFERQKQLIDNFVHKFREFQTTCTINIGPQKKGQEKDRKEKNELDKQKKRTQYRTQ